MSQALSADPSALCKLEQRDCFPLIFFGKLSSGGDKGKGCELGNREAKDVEERSSSEGFVKYMEKTTGPWGDRESNRVICRGKRHAYHKKEG